MIEIRMVLEEKGTPRQLISKLRTRILKAALERGGDYWHDRILPRHFRPGARHKYGHRRRSKSYQRKKEKIFRHNIDNVWTGRMMDQVTSGRWLSGTAKRITVRMSVPWYASNDQTARELSAMR